MEQPTAAIDAARQVACAVVRERFPELAEAEPQVSQPARQRAHPADIERLGLPVAPPAPHTSTEEYTFTFRREIDLGEGHRIARIAKVTVDAAQRIVKTILSK